MRNSKPLIGVTGPDKGGTSAWWFTKLAVWRAGGKAQRITPSTPFDAEQLDGLIIGGGADIDPSRYGEEFDTDKIASEKPDKGVLDWLLFGLKVLFYPAIYLLRRLFSTPEHGTDRKRDDLEFPLLKHAVSSGLPVLGICRGSQLINVYCGGNLYRDLSDFYGEIPQIYSIWPKKTIELDPHSRLAAILDTNKAKVNALHKQAVKSYGDSLKPVAKEESGVIQAIEHSDIPFLIGVQWHPEYLPQKGQQQRLFRALVDAARDQSHAGSTQKQQSDRSSQQDPKPEMEPA